MTAPTVGLGTLRRVSELGASGQRVLSVYLDLDSRASSSVAACAGQLEMLLGELPPQASEADVARAKEMLRSMPALAPGTRGLALFSTAEGCACAAVPLPASVETMVLLDTMPWLEPLAGMFASGEWGVALFGRRSARLLRGGPTALVEFATLHDGRDCTPIPGDCSQRDSRLLLEEHLAEHAERVMSLLARAHRRQAFERLAVVAPRELWRGIERALAGELRERLAGLIPLRLQDASAREITQALAELMRQSACGGMWPAGMSTITAPRAALPRRACATSTRCLPRLAVTPRADSDIGRLQAAGVDAASRANGASEPACL